MIRKNNIVISTSCTLALAVCLFVVVNIYLKPLDIVIFATGVIFGMCNFYALLWAWSRIFIKKRIALALGVIVIKYAIVLSVLYYLVIDQNVDVLSFVLGMFSMIVITLFFSTFMYKNLEYRKS